MHFEPNTILPSMYRLPGKENAKKSLDTVPQFLHQLHKNQVSLGDLTKPEWGTVEFVMARAIQALEPAGLVLTIAFLRAHASFLAVWWLAKIPSAVIRSKTTVFPIQQTL